ncbi:LOW QUALITY PROTEIN: hypothetical protein Dda_0230 [Drechslerella dactyloides]|uniref:NIPSNAP domain-containing protein n=1 Tax=Drechslerella dactyloides TaxID=74499 RepID=A0AAD6J3Z5_DREDA|nr:LOW QUALITY PROTEIN: hypothetical protein Dda_0230 [Drechslerella dactyloides]
MITVISTVCLRFELHPVDGNVDSALLLLLRYPPLLNRALPIRNLATLNLHGDDDAPFLSLNVAFRIFEPIGVLVRLAVELLLVAAALQDPRVAADRMRVRLQLAAVQVLQELCERAQAAVARGLRGRRAGGRLVLRGAWRARGGPVVDEERDVRVYGNVGELARGHDDDAGGGGRREHAREGAAGEGLGGREVHSERQRLSKVPSNKTKRGRRTKRAWLRHESTSGGRSPVKTRLSEAIARVIFGIDRTRTLVRRNSTVELEKMKSATRRQGAFHTTSTIAILPSAPDSPAVVFRNRIHLDRGVGVLREDCSVRVLPRVKQLWAPQFPRLQPRSTSYRSLLPQIASPRNPPPQPHHHPRIASHHRYQYPAIMFRPAFTAPLVSRPLLRAAAVNFSTSASRFKHTPPSIGQLPADSLAKFNDNRKTFHEKQTAAQEAARREANPDAPDGPEIKTGGVLAKLLHGSSEAQQDTFQIQESFSKVLARGKYVHELVFHRVKPDAIEDYVELIGNEYPRIANDEKSGVKLVGSWYTEIGEGDVFVHIWEYNGYAGYHDTMRYLNGQPQTKKLNTEVRKHLQSRYNSIAQEFSFWPTTQPRTLGGVFELRSYTLHPGNLLEWETHWRKGLAARQSQGMEGVGAWFTQIGGLNEVHYLWQFGDLRGRQLLREKSWQAEGWADTVHKTVPLIAKMQSKILLPLPWSPVK